MRVTNALLALLFAFTAAACKGGPIQPAPPERAALYTGKWSGTINGWEVVLHIQASAGELIGMNGTGTGRNPATQEIRNLNLLGFGSLTDASTASFVLTLATDQTGSVQRLGEFRGNVTRDGRRWPGVWIATANDDAPIFGVGTYSVTLIKE